MRIRGIRGAIQLHKDSAEEMVEAVSELLTQMLTANQIDTEDLISIILTATPDLTQKRWNRILSGSTLPHQSHLALFSHYSPSDSVIVVNSH